MYLKIFKKIDDFFSGVCPKKSHQFSWKSSNKFSEIYFRNLFEDFQEKKTNFFWQNLNNKIQIKYT